MGKAQGEKGACTRPAGAFAELADGTCEPRVPREVHHHPRLGGGSDSGQALTSTGEPCCAPRACDLGQRSLPEPRFSHLSNGNSPCVTSSVESRVESLLERCSEFSVPMGAGEQGSLVTVAGCGWPLATREAPRSSFSSSVITRLAGGNSASSEMTPLWGGHMAP